MYSTFLLECSVGESITCALYASKGQSGCEGLTKLLGSNSQEQDSHDCIHIFTEVAFLTISQCGNETAGLERRVGKPGKSAEWSNIDREKTGWRTKRKRANGGSPIRSSMLSCRTIHTGQIASEGGREALDTN